MSDAFCFLLAETPAVAELFVFILVLKLCDPLKIRAMSERLNEKFVLLWGPLFVGAPVRPNMLNMPKSASG